MASSTKIVGTCVDETSVGTRIWANPSNATADDTNYATTPNVKATSMHYLFGTMSGNVFSIPGGSTIDGVVVMSLLSQTTSSSFHDGLVKLILSGSAAGTSQGRGSSVFWPTSEAIQTWGSGVNKWGNTLTPAIVNAADFGACIQGSNLSANKSVASVDYIQIRVYYTEGATPKDVDGESTTAVTTSATVTKTTSADGELTTAVTTDTTVTKETDISASSTTGVTTDGSVEAERPVDGSSTTGVTTSASVTKTVAVDGTATTAVTTDTSVTKVTDVEGSATTGVTTDASVQIVKPVDGESTTGVTTDASVTKTVSIDGSATTGVTTDATVTKVVAVDGSLTTSVTTDAEVTKVRNVDGESTTAVTTDATVTKTVSVEGELTTGVTTSVLVESVKTVEGSATTAVTTSTDITKETEISGSLTTQVRTDITITGELVGYATFTDGMGTPESLVVAPHFSDHIYTGDVLEEDNYAPLKDPKPGVISPGWHGGHGVTAKAYPIGDINYDPNNWRTWPAHGTWWQHIDNDVDLPDTTDSVASLQVLPPYSPLALYFTGLPADWGVVENVTVRLRTTIGAVDSGNGTITYYTRIYKDGSTSIAAQDTSINPDGVTNVIYEETFSGVNLTILEFNTITANFSYLVKDSGGIPVSSPRPTVYAVDIIASRQGDEKIITEDSWPETKPISSDFDSTKNISEDVWTERDPSGSGWEPK